MNHDKQVVVWNVSPNSPAKSAGFVDGDIIRSIDGKPANVFDDLIEIRKLLKADTGTSYKIVVERNGEQRELELSLATLY